MVYPEEAEDAARPVRVVVADDNPVVLRGLHAVLAGQADIEVVGEASDGREAVRVAVETQPDLVLLDVRMPVLDGPGAARELAGRFPVMMLTYSDDPDEVAAAIAAGARGYLVHGQFRIEDLLRAVRGSARGESHLSPTVAAAAVQSSRYRPDVVAGGSVALSAREIEVMHGVAQGMSNREVADSLFVSEKTVKNHLSRIFVKLGVHSRTEAVALFTGRVRRAAPARDAREREGGVR